MSPAFPLIPPLLPFPSYCCSSIASLSFPSHPSHSPLCPPLPFATHCLLLYFLFPLSFPSLHLGTDFFPGENILPSGSVKAHCKKSPLTIFSPSERTRTKPLLQKGTQTAWKYLFPVFFPLSGSEVLWLCQPHRFLSWVPALCIKPELLPGCVYKLIEFSFTASLWTTG